MSCGAVSLPYIDNCNGSPKLRRLQPSEASFDPDRLAYQLGRPFVRSAVFDYRTKTDEVSGDRLNALSRSATRMLCRIRIDRKTMHPFKQSPIGIFTRQYLRIRRPTCRRRFHIIVYWATGVGQNGAATYARRASHSVRSKTPNVQMIRADGWRDSCASRRSDSRISRIRQLVRHVSHDASTSRSKTQRFTMPIARNTYGTIRFTCRLQEGYEPNNRHENGLPPPSTIPFVLPYSFRIPSVVNVTPTIAGGAKLMSVFKRFRFRLSRPSLPNVLVSRANERAAPAPQEPCLRQASAPIVDPAQLASLREDRVSFRQRVSDKCVVICVTGHLKTSQWWSLQNQPI